MTRRARLAAGAAVCAALAGCGAASGPAQVPASEPAGSALVVRPADTAFTFADGAAARRQADAVCGGQVRTSIYDRFDAATGAWVFVEGCA